MSARALRLPPLLAGALLAAAVAAPSPALAGGSACSQATASPARASAVSVARATVCLLNRERARYGLRPLRLESRLSRAAVGHSIDMARRNYFAHGDVAGRIRRSGWMRGRGSWTAGENLAWGSGPNTSPAAIVRMWMNSPGHRANVLRASFREVGIGAVAGAPVPGVRDAAIYTADFGG